MIRYITLFCISLLLFSGGCERSETPAAPMTSETAPPTTVTPASDATATTEPAKEELSLAPAVILLQEPIVLQRYEVPSQALLQWYAVRDLRPALVLYANDPLLLSTSNLQPRELLARLHNQDQRALRSDIADPVIMPKMALNAALDAGLFSAVYWVMPSPGEIADLSVEIFRSQMTQNDSLTADEALSMTLRNGIFSGTVRGIPFHALHPKADFNISGPAVFHFDLSYLVALYKGEIKTPIYPLVYQTLKHLRDEQIETVSASFSYSQIIREVALGSRFLGDVFKQLFEQPQLLDSNMPVPWEKRANALYLPNMMLYDEARDLLLQMADAQPDDASLHYALYKVSRETKATRGVALRHLADAVQRDPVYAYEYLSLVPIAREKGYPDEAVRVLSLARKANPDNPLITLELASAFVATGQTETAVPLLQELLALNWSQRYYPDMPSFLERLLAEARN
jgi:tetratricopeptide (TPR) repeat protein